MPNLNNFERKPLFKNNHPHLLQNRREEILYREDLKTGFVYAVVGIAASLTLAGIIYVVGKKLIS